MSATSLATIGTVNNLKKMREPYKIEVRTAFMLLLKQVASSRIRNTGHGGNTPYFNTILISQ